MGHHEAELRRPGWIRLANLEGASGCFSGQTVHYRAPCLASEFSTCHVVRQLSLWNELLLYVHLELRVLPDSNGLLGLFNIEGDEPCLYQLSQVRAHQGATLVYWLLHKHHCVVLLEAHEDIVRMYPDIFSGILRSNTKLKVLKLHVLRTGFLESLRLAIPSMTHLEKLHCTSNESCPARLLVAISKLLRTTTSLTELKASALSIDSHPAEMMFFASLAANTSLRSLILEYDARYGRYKLAFEDYIKGTNTLTTLKIAATSEIQSEVWLRSILRGLLVNRSITSVTLKGFNIDNSCVEILAKVIRRNNVLCVLNVGSLRPLPPPRQLQKVGEKCIDAISQNESLEELTLPLRIWKPVLWNYLFTALAPESNLKINICACLAGISLMRIVCRQLRDSGAEQKVFLGAYNWGENSCPDECEAFSELRLFDRTFGEFEHILLERLPSFTRLKKLSFKISPRSVAYDSVIARYIAETSTLEALHILVYCHEPFGNFPNTWWTNILQALSQNSSILELEVSMFSLGMGNLEKLAEAIKTSKNIGRLTMSFLKPKTSTAFLHSFSKDISANYTLTRVTLHSGIVPSEDWFSVMDTARRNRDLVSCAVLFATGAMIDKYCASALETVAQHRGLLREFADLATGSEAAAEEMIASALQSLQEMDNFMRAVGVVRDRVVCYPREDGSMQLDELYRDCWLHVRKYLQLDDVKYPGPVS